MEVLKEHNKPFYFLEGKRTNFVVLRELNSKIAEEIKTQLLKLKPKENNSLVFDFWNINDSLSVKNQNDINEIIKSLNPNSIVMKHCRIKESFEFIKNELELEGLYITDELYSLSPFLSDIFKNIKTEKMVLKKIKINSKEQLKNFFDFIKMTECEELILDDIFIELLIKKNEKDEESDNLNQYFSLGNEKILIINENGKKEETNIEKLKLIDCPLFFFPDNDNNKSLNNILNNKNISIDIDENSLLNPGMITKIKIKEGLIDICYDLDSYKINIDENKDYIEYIEYIINKIKNNNNKYRKIKFKNFDINKLEYIIEDNNNNINENKIILNKKEKEKKYNYEIFINNIKNKINNIKLNNIKDIIFDNCTNDFIELILLMINNNNNINLLKFKKCNKNNFNINSISLFNIHHLFLFDTPIEFGELKEENKNKISEEELKKQKLTLKIVSLEHYCRENNLKFYNVMGSIRNYLQNTKRGEICFEMNALPVLMTFLMAENYNNIMKIEEDQKEIKTYFPKIVPNNDNQKDDKNDSNEYDRQKIIELKDDNFINLDCLQNEKIILKRNNIRNKLENYYYVRKANNNLDFEKEDKHKNDISSHGKEIAYLDEDYRAFFKINEIDEITIENCLFSNYEAKYFKAKDTKKNIEKENNDTIYNFIHDREMKYKIDMKTLKEIIFRNNSVDDFAYIMKFYTKKEDKDEHNDTENTIDEGAKKSNDDKKNDDNIVKENKIMEENVINFIDVLCNLFNDLNGKITIIINNIIELKEFYCLLCFLDEKSKIDDQEPKSIKPKKSKNEKKWVKYKELTGEEKISKKNNILDCLDKVYERIKNYFVLEKDYKEGEKYICTIFNYYNTDSDEIKLLGEGDCKRIFNKNFKYHIDIELKFDDRWEIIFN